MLSIATVADHRASYYLDDLGDELGRVAPAHVAAAGRWIGRSAAHLGLSGPVAAPTLRTVLDGNHPRSGSALVRRRRAVAGFDLTFSAPKSVSILFALGGEAATREVLASHDAAVRAAVDHLERRALAVRRGSADERRVMATDGMVGAGFLHCLSRAGDPHLHTHVVAANVAHGADGRWSALDGRGLFAHARAAGALYGAHLRAELTDRLDVAWSWHQGRGWDLEGIDHVLRAAFCGRGAEIRERLAAFGTTSRRAHQVAWAATRPGKDRSSADELMSSWATRARVAGSWEFTPPSVRRNAPGTGRLDEHRFAAALADAAPSGVCRRDVVAAWGQSLAHGIRAEGLERAVDHWAPGQGEVGVAEARHAPASYVPARHLLGTLGPRPADAEGQPPWRRAAQAIDRYRARWGVSEERALGCDAEHRSALPTLRLAEHIEVSRTIHDALSRLGGPPRNALEREGLVFERR